MAKKKKKRSFVFHDLWFEIFRSLPPEPAQELLLAVEKYHNGEPVDIKDPVLIPSFNLIKAMMDEDNDEYKRVCKERSKASSDAWEKRKQENTNAYKSIQNVQKHTNDTDIDIDIDIDIDTDIDTVTDVSSPKVEDTKVTDGITDVMPSSQPVADYDAILRTYNQTCVSYPRIKVMSEKRKKSVKARLRTGYSIQDFETVFQKAEASDFLKGKNDRNWSATFDWMISDANMAKILDGNYDNKASPGPGGKGPDTNNPFLRRLMQMEKYDDS